MGDVSINPVISSGNPESEFAATFSPAPDVSLSAREVENIADGVAAIAFVATHLDELTAIHDTNGSSWDPDSAEIVDNEDVSVDHLFLPLA